MPQRPVETLVQRLIARVDLTDPTPVYHQIAAAIGHEVATGRLAIGATLPSLRELASALGVHYHTVRAAYDALAVAGVVRSRQGRGTVVVHGPTSRSTSPVETVAWAASASLWGGALLAQQLMAGWRIVAASWPIGAAAPPPGLILTPKELVPLAHSAWPTRERDVHSLELDADGATLAVIRRNADRLKVRRIVLVASTDPAEQRVLRQLAVQLPRLGLHVHDAAIADAHPQDHALTCYPPSAWQTMEWEQRSHPSALSLEMRFAAGPVARVARQFGWRAA